MTAIPELFEARTLEPFREVDRSLESVVDSQLDLIPGSNRCSNHHRKELHAPRCQAVPRRSCRTTFASARSASSTEVESGKTSNTSGSMMETIVPCLYREALTPRIAPLKSYSGRIVSRSAFPMKASSLLLRIASAPVVSPASRR